MSDIEVMIPFTSKQNVASTILEIFRENSRNIGFRMVCHYCRVFDGHTVFTKEVVDMLRKVDRQWYIRILDICGIAPPLSALDDRERKDLSDYQEFVTWLDDNKDELIYE